MRIGKDHLIIHLFALLHAAVAFGCRVFGLMDGMILTLLSMVLVVILCFRRNMSSPFMMVCLIFANICGYFLGTWMAGVLGSFISSPFVENSLATFAVTEILGWGTLLATKLPIRKSTPIEGSKQVRWLMIAFLAVVLLRLGLNLFPGESLDQKSTLVSIMLDYVCTFAAIFYLAEYAITAKDTAQKAEADANLAEFRYMKLKQQVNPHFLFNSLNMLDCMIHEQTPEEASLYTHKLAEIYRYMIRHDNETTVSLAEEMEFVTLYTDLLKVRFQDAFEVSLDINPSCMEKKVVPCSLQLLLENATKHNSASKRDPLRVEIKAEGDSLTVTNNLRAKLSLTSGTGLGLNYIRQQYRDIADKEISVEKTEQEYIVTLPLI